MNRLLIASALGCALLTTLPAVAQRGGDNDPDRAVTGGQFPAGWNVRPDRGAAQQIQFTESGGVDHFTMGPAGTFYNPAWMKSGNYSFSARLIQRAAPTHPISYGLMFGGSNLAGDMQTYSYFLVRNQGEFFVANRDGNARPTTVVPWTANPAIMKQGADGKQTNTLGVQVQGDEIIFTVNGTEVTRLPKNKVHTDGLFGFRIGHNLDVDVDQIKR